MQTLKRQAIETYTENAMNLHDLAIIFAEPVYERKSMAIEDVANIA